MDLYDSLDRLKKLAGTDKSLRDELLATRKGSNSLSNFCRIASAHGCDISAIDMINAGEESYAAMRRSTNGGGENSPLLQGEDDLYEMFLMEIE